MPKQLRIENIIRTLPLFSVCDEAFLLSLIANVRLISLDKGQILFLHEDDAANFFIVKRGWIKLFRETLDGTQAVVDILSERHLFGETSIFEGDKYPYSAEAAEATSIIALPLKLLKDEIDTNPNMAKAMLGAMARYRKQQDQELEHRTLQNAPQRIGCFLLRLIRQDEVGAVTIHLPYDKTLVASRLGMQPETFSRALNKLKQETGIQIKGATITMESVDQLVGYSCAACSSEFPCKDLDVKSVCS